MRLAFLILLALLVGGGPGSAWAEKAKAKDGAKLFNRAGEQGKVLFKLKEGQVMRILKTDGRWHKVNVKGRTGWIMRTKVEVMEEEVARNTRRRPFVDGRGTKRGFGGETGPDDRVGADAVDPSGGGEDDEPKKPTKPSSDDGDDDDDSGDEPKKPPKKPAKPPKKPSKPSSDDDEDEIVVADDGDTAGEEPKTGEEEGEEITDDRPKVKVVSKATVYSEPDDESEEAEWKVKTGMVLFVNKKKGKFVEVENDETDIGYILSSKVEEVEGGDDVGGPSSRQIDVRARLGVTIIQQGMRSNGPGMLPDNYNLSTSAATIALGGAYLRPYGKKYMIGGEANFDIAKAVPGIKNGAQTIGITLYHLNARGLFGYDLKKKSGMMVFGRLGLRYQSYQVGDVTNLMKNTAKLPSEIITTPTFGAALAIPRLTDKIGLRFSLDAMLVGTSLKQTKNLEDGNKPKAKGAIVGAGFTYRWKPNMDIQATYDLNYTKYAFGAAIATSMRGHMATGEVKRTDVFHGVTVGIAKAF